MLFPALLALLAPCLTGAVGSAAEKLSFRAHNAAGTQDKSAQRLRDSAPECTCDCCVALAEVHGVAGNDESNNGPACGPRSGAGIPGGAVGDGDGGCSTTCGVNEYQAAFLDARGNEVDYSLYCLKSCRPAGPTTGFLCASKSDSDLEALPKMATGTNAGATSGSSGSSQNAMTQISGKVQASTDDDPGQAALIMAKSEMEAAQQQAISAGAAAKVAKQSYEYVLRSARAAAEASGRATIADIRKEAGLEAGRALLARQKYEAEAKEKASKAAVAAAMVYKKAQVRDIAIATTWNQRAAEYSTAAGQRKAMAQDFARQAEGARAIKQWDRAQQYMVSAHQSMDQAAEFAAKAEGAHKQAFEIQKGVLWYNYAAQAMAATVLAKSMPVDVAPPPMPALPAL